MASSEDTHSEVRRTLKALESTIARIEGEQSNYRLQIEELQAQGAALTLVLAHAIGADAVERGDGFSHLSNLLSGVKSDTKRMRSARVQEVVRRAYVILDTAKKNYDTRRRQRAQN